MRSLTHDRNASGRSPLLALGSYAPLMSDACPPLGCDRAGRQASRTLSRLPLVGPPLRTYGVCRQTGHVRRPNIRKARYPLLRRRYWRGSAAILVGGIDSHDSKRATIVCRRPGMYPAVELIEGRRILLVRLHRDTASDGNPSVRCQQAVFMLPHTHNHVRRRWATHRNKKPGCNHRGHGNTANNLHGSPQVIDQVESGIPEELTAKHPSGGVGDTEACPRKTKPCPQSSTAKPCWPQNGPNYNR
jgi:hypothetical protein